MQPEGLLLNIVFVPLIGAAILPLVGRLSLRWRNLLALFFVADAFVLTLRLVPIVIAGKTVLLAKSFPFGLNFSFQADGLAVFMAIVSSLISLIIVLYSLDYISHYENQNEYYAMVVLFLGAMMGIVFSSNLILLYIFWEVTAICSWRLIGFFREKPFVLKADKAFLVTFFGSICMLLGFIMLYQQSGSFELSTIRETFKTSALPDTVVLLILIGIFSKSATLPFHTWLPDAGVAPSPVTALLHAAVLVKIGVYVFSRLCVATFNISSIWHTIVPIVAVISAIISAGAALVETDLKRIIAYSTISQIGFIFFGLAINNWISFLGCLLYILAHGIAKAGLFLCAGLVEQNAKTKDIRRLGGLYKTMPITAISFLFCSLSVMGIPPFAGFFSKYFLFSGALQYGRTNIAFVFLCAAFLTIIYLLRVFNLVFMGEPREQIQAGEKSPLMVFSVASLGILSLLSGLLIIYPYNFCRLVTLQIRGFPR